MPSVFSSADEADDDADDADDGDQRAACVERRPPDERLLEQAVEEGDATGDDEREEQRVAPGELFELPLVGDPVLPTGCATLLGDRVDLHLADESLGEHDDHASDPEERGQRDDEAR